MTTVRVLELLQNHDQTVKVTFTNADDGTDHDLTGETVEFYLKNSAGDDDTAATTKKYSSAGPSPAITITAGSKGVQNVALVSIPAADAVSGLTFFRADALISGKRSGAVYGPAEIVLQ